VVGAFTRYAPGVASWSDFLASPSPHGHAVQIYRDVAELADSVALYFDTGLAAGAPALLVTVEEHRPFFVDRLTALGWDVDDLTVQGRLVIRDARVVLDTFMRDDYPSSAAFDEMVGGLIDGLAQRFPLQEPRVFGEMVDVLVKDGADEAAISLEELWNSLAWSRRFSLLCGYELDVFDVGNQSERLPDICRTHSHVKAAHDDRRLALAVDSALEEVLGPAEAGKVYVVVAQNTREDRIPSPQLILMWVAEHLPTQADEILSAARANYAAA
jgi:MEDS: MEthanogen/methylotroph, DcmR Sensory domain